jgi:DNA-directed RNA polymerase specialized sigma24 family protein
MCALDGFDVHDQHDGGRSVLLRKVQELSYREIAEVTEVSIGTVMSRLARARSRVISIVRTAGVRPS